MRVVPTGLPSSTECCRKFSSLPKVNEMDLISAVLSGHLDDSIIVSAPGKIVHYSYSTLIFHFLSKMKLFHT